MPDSLPGARGNIRAIQKEHSLWKEGEGLQMKTQGASRICPYWLRVLNQVLPP